MNVILILVDSLNKYMLEPYGGERGLTPNFQRFAQKACKFENHYVGSLPCMPARREIFTGRKDFLWRPWGHLEAFDRPLPREVERHGYKTQMVTDHYHYWEQGAHGYIESFQGLEMIRGHELDYWKTDPLTDIPEWVQGIEQYRPGWGKRYYKNVKDFQDERDFFPAKVMTAAADWLQVNHGDQPYFLQIESFDIHEPFHCPEPYRSMYTEHTNNSYNCWPPYQDPERQREFFRNTTPEELDFIRGQYKGKLAMLDKWLGHVFDKMDELNVWEDTAVIVTTDHGHDLGERETFGKMFPHWDSHANIPLMIYHPDFPAAQSIDALTSTVDLNATILELCNVGDSQPVHSRSVIPLIDGSQKTIREALLYGSYGAGACCTDGKHVLLQGYDNEQEPMNIYTGVLSYPSPQLEVTSGHYIPDVALPVWKIPVQTSGKRDSILFSRQDPYNEEVNIIDQDQQLTQRMRDLMIDLMQEEGCPPEQFRRLGLVV